MTGTTWEQLLALGWTPSADELHEDLFAPTTGEARELRGSFEDRGRSAGFDRGRGSYR